MKYSKEEVIQFVTEDDVKFIRLAFTDIFGKQKNISIQPSELPRAFSDGIAIDASAIAGFGGLIRSDLLLQPDPDTLEVLPWRSEHGMVVRLFCTIAYPGGRTFENDTRSILKTAIAEAAAKGYAFSFGSELEFYLFKLDENGLPTKIPYDSASYMDIAPADKGENVRREICLTLEAMGIHPESSHHEEGPGQNEIDFRFADALTAADNAVAFRGVVETIAARSGLAADFSPKPLSGHPGSGFHINMSVRDLQNNTDPLPFLVAGVLAHSAEMTLFFNAREESYARLGSRKAPRFIAWGEQNRSCLIRIPAASGAFRRAELRSPDPLANPYLAFALLIYAALDGIERKLPLPKEADINLFMADSSLQEGFEALPASRKEAVAKARESAFLEAHLPEALIKAYCE